MLGTIIIVSEASQMFGLVPAVVHPGSSAIKARPAPRLPAWQCWSRQFLQPKVDPTHALDLTGISLTDGIDSGWKITV